MCCVLCCVYGVVVYMYCALRVMRCALLYVVMCHAIDVVRCVLLSVDIVVCDGGCALRVLCCALRVMLYLCWQCVSWCV